MKKLFVWVLFVALMVAAAGVAQAAPKPKPEYVTQEQLQTAIAAVTADFQSQIAVLTARVTELETRLDNLPPNKPEPPFPLNIILNETSITVADRFIQVVAYTSTPLQIRPNPFYPNPVWHQPLDRVNYWGILHTPNGDIDSQVHYERVGNGGYDAGFIIFEMPSRPPTGTVVEAEIFAFYAGKVTSVIYPITM